MMKIFLFVAFFNERRKFHRRKMVVGEKMMEGGWLMQRESNFRNGGMRIFIIIMCVLALCFVVRKIILMMLVGIKTLL